MTFSKDNIPLDNDHRINIVLPYPLFKTLTSSNLNFIQHCINKLKFMTHDPDSFHCPSTRAYLMPKLLYS